MATATLGTAATTTLTALQFIYGMTPADFATMAAAIKRDAYNPEMNDAAVNPATAGPQPPIDAAYAAARLGMMYTRSGLLTIPDRGVLRLFPGDYVGVDASGWPILLSARAAASASWVHT